MKSILYLVVALVVAALLLLGYRALVVHRPPPPESASAAGPAPDSVGMATDVPDDVQVHIQAHADLVRLASPAANEVIESPVTITGEARGPWYFEASFPVVLVDRDGLIIAESVATAAGEWMTEEFVPFRATLEFDRPDYGERGTIILQKQNASGLPEHDDALEVPIRFSGD